MNLTRFGWIGSLLLAAIVHPGAPAGCVHAETANADDVASLKAGATFTVDGRRATLTRLEYLPLVENGYTRRFQFDTFENSRLSELRKRYGLAEVVAGGKDEFDQQVLLLDWVHNRFPKFGTPTAQPHGAAEILRDVEAGHTFFCAHFADVLVSAAASLGWVDRSLALRRPDHLGTGSTEHSSTEIWSNQFGRWVMFDPTFAMYVEKDGLPLNALELREEWFKHDGSDLTFVIGKQRQKYRRSELPIFRRHFAGFGDLSVDASALNVYAFIGYVPNTNLLDAGPDYGRMFIWRDELCAGTSWHQRALPTDPANECYFPIGQAALELRAQGTVLSAQLKTLTPNFMTYRIRFDDGHWQDSGASFRWTLHPGSNRLEARTLNRFGVGGPISTAEVLVETTAADKP